MKKILLSSLLAVMAVTSANAKIASTEYVDEVAQTKADAAQAAAVQTAKTYTDGLTGDVVNSEYIKGLTNKTLTGAVENLDTRVKGLTGTGTEAAATKQELEDGLAAKLDKNHGVDNAGKGLIVDDSGNLALAEVATDEELATKLDKNQGTENTGKGLIVDDSGDLALADVATDTELATKLDKNQGAVNAGKGLIVDNSGDLALADVATGAELDAVSEVADNAKTIADGAVTVNTQQETAISKNTTDIATNTAAINTINSSDVMNSGATKDKIDAIALNTALREAIKNNAEDNRVNGAGQAGTYVLTAVVNDEGVSDFKWELIDRAIANQ